jgi:hypothetical protein
MRMSLDRMTRDEQFELIADMLQRKPRGAAISIGELLKEVGLPRTQSNARVVRDMLVKYGYKDTPLH